MPSMSCDTAAMNGNATRSTPTHRSRETPWVTLTKASCARHIYKGRSRDTLVAITPTTTGETFVDLPGVAGASNFVEADSRSALSELGERGDQPLTLVPRARSRERVNTIKSAPYPRDSRLIHGRAHFDPEMLVSDTSDLVHRAGSAGEQPRSRMRPRSIPA